MSRRPEQPAPDVEQDDVELLGLLVGEVLHEGVDGGRVEAALATDGLAPGSAATQLEGRYEARCPGPGDAEQPAISVRGRPRQRGDRDGKGFTS